MFSTIRHATVQDAKLLAELNRHVQIVHATEIPALFRPTPDLAEVTAEMADVLKRDGYFGYLANVDEVLAGYVLVEHIFKPDRPRTISHEMIYVHHISVCPEFRRKGVGNALLDAAKDHGRSLGVELFALDVWTFNVAAKKFFQNYGLTNFNEKMWMKI